MKLQFWSFDVIFAMVIFGFAITILAFVWYSISNQFSLSYGYGVGSMQMQAQALANKLLTPGAPSSWYSIINMSNPSTWANVSIGLLGGSGQVSLEKIATLESMANTNYQATKQAVGVGYDYYIILNYQGMKFGIGLNPYVGNAMSIYVVSKPIIINNVPATMQIMVWTNTSFGVA
ncbi:MAG: hypothetical protein ACP5P2_02865 [Candidatus Micrarchaeia archaeon]|jgi:hypothetical protein